MKNRKIIASCMLALSLVGCTGLEAGNGAYTAGGTAGGAALGAIAGQVIGKDTKGTLIGAAVGSLLGMGWGAYKDNQARELRAALKGTQAEVRNDVDYIITEYGIAHLKGKTLRERAKLLIEIAHPKFREELRKRAIEKFEIL